MPRTDYTDLVELIEQMVDAKIEKALAMEKHQSVTPRVATVSEVDGEGRIWVDVGDQQVPIAYNNADVEPGDLITYSVANGRAYLGGNYSAPATSRQYVDRGITQVNRIVGKVKDDADLAKIAAEEADKVAKATNQHFWHRATDPDEDGAGTGAFVTDEEQASFLSAIAAGTEPTETRPLHNLLMNVEGILLRAAKRVRAAFMPSGVAFFDGEGNEEDNVVASFGKDGARIGRSNTYKTDITDKALAIKDEYDNEVLNVGGVSRNEPVWVEESFRLSIPDVENVPPIRLFTYEPSEIQYSKYISGSAQIWGEFEVEDVELTEQGGVDDVEFTEQSESTSSTISTWDILFSFSIGTVGSSNGFDHELGWWWNIDGSRVYYTELSFDDISDYPWNVQIAINIMNGAGVRKAVYDPSTWSVSFTLTDAKIAYFESTYGSRTDLLLLYSSKYWAVNANVPALIYGASDWETDWPRSEYATAAGSSPYSYKGNAAGYYSADLGKDCRPSGPYSLVNGRYSESAGTASHAEGSHTFAFGEASHAEGSGTEALGNYSHSEGENTRAVGKWSHAEGRGTVAYPDAQSVVGRYNVVDEAGEYAFIVGNGSSPIPKNAFAVGWDGSMDVAEDATIGGMLDVAGTATHNNNILLVNSSMDRDGAIPSSEQDRFIAVRDKDNETVAALRGVIGSTTAGNIGAQLVGYGENSSGTTVANRLGVYVNRNGEYVYTLSSPAAFCSALHVGDYVTDSASNVSTATSAYKDLFDFTLPAGTWLVFANLEFAANGTGRRVAMVNTTAGGSGISLQWRATEAAVTGAVTRVRIAGVLKPTASTKYYLTSWQNSGGNLNVTAVVQAVRVK